MSQQLDSRSQVCCAPSCSPEQKSSMLTACLVSDWFRNRKAKEQKGRRSRDALSYPRLDIIGTSVRLAQPPQGDNGALLSRLLPAKAHVANATVLDLQPLSLHIGAFDATRQKDVRDPLCIRTLSSANRPTCQCLGLGKLDQL